MILRNKKTGQIGSFIINKDHIECVDLEYVPEYSTLAELNKEWEDAPEEPKEFYWIDEVGEIDFDVICEEFKEDIDSQKTIGNYFGTREEAKKVVEKLKAWKRLKDKGFSFHGYDDGYKHDFNSGHIEFYVKNSGDVLADLDLLFSGGEE